MDRVRHVALFCVGRTALLGWAAIFGIMLTLSFDPEVAFRAGAVLGLALSAYLSMRAAGASAVVPSRSQVWIYLDEANRQKAHSATADFDAVLREVHALYAESALFLACVLFAVSIALSGLDGLTALRDTASTLAG